MLKLCYTCQSQQRIAKPVYLQNILTYVTVPFLQFQLFVLYCIHVHKMMSLEGQSARLHLDKISIHNKSRLNLQYVPLLGPMFSTYLFSQIVYFSTDIVITNLLVLC